LGGWRAKAGGRLGGCGAPIVGPPDLGRQPGRGQGWQQSGFGWLALAGTVPHSARLVVSAALHGRAAAVVPACPAGSRRTGEYGTADNDAGPEVSLDLTSQCWCGWFG